MTCQEMMELIDKALALKLNEISCSSLVLVGGAAFPLNGKHQLLDQVSQ